MNVSENQDFSLRSSRFLSFSKRSRKGGKLRKSGKISSSTPSPFLLTPSLLLPNFLAHPRHAPSLARFSFACSISAPPEKGKESAATQAIRIYNTLFSYILSTLREIFGECNLRESDITEIHRQCTVQKLLF